MVLEIPVDGSNEVPDAEPVTNVPEQPAYEEPSNVEPQTPVPKRGRPKKEASGSLRAEGAAPPKPIPVLKRPVGRPRKTENQPQRKEQAAPPEEPFRATLGSLSSVELLKELMDRKRASDREARTNLYKSFVL